MTGFISKKINTIQTLGEKLRHHRHSIGLSKEKAAKMININVRYLTYLEADNYQSMPADVYAANILKSYANLLGLNPATVMDLYEKEKNLFYKTQKQKEKNTISAFYQLMNRFLNPRTIKYFIIFLILLSVFVYIGLEVNKIISPPELIIISPSDNFVTSEHQIKIQGQTEKEVRLEINNRPLLSDDQGNFTLIIDLQKGLNIIKISAQKKHSKEQVAYRQVIVSEEAQ